MGFLTIMKIESHRKLQLFSLIFVTCLFLLIVQKSYGVTFEKAKFEQDVRYFKNEPLELYGEFRMFLNGTVARYIDLKAALGSSYKKLNEDYNTSTLIWAMEIEYSPLKGLSMGIGHKKINYSPYVFHSETWQDNFLQGLFFHIKESEYVQIDAFIAMHAEDDTKLCFNDNITNKILTPQLPENVQLNLGAIAEQNFDGVWQEHPAIWGGGCLYLSPFDGIYFKEIYVHENYQVDKWGEGYLNYNNDIYLSSLELKPIHWFKIDLLYSIMSKNIHIYKGAWNLYGKGQNGMILDFSERQKPKAREIAVCFQSPDEEAQAGAQFKLSVIYRDIDIDYNPLHMNNGLFDEGRGEDELNDIFSGEKGFVIKFNKSFSSKIDVYVEKLQLEEGIIYNNKIDDTRNEYRGGICGQQIMDIFKFSLIYRTIKFDHTEFKGGQTKLNGWLLCLGAVISKYFSMEFSFIEHRYWITHNNEFLGKLIFQF